VVEVAGADFTGSLGVVVGTVVGVPVVGAGGAVDRAVAGSAAGAGSVELGLVSPSSLPHAPVEISATADAAMMVSRWESVIRMT
jgi:hypothetical protein